MARKPYRPTGRVTDRLHPGLYLALAFLALWFVFSAWAFGGDGYTDYLLVVASGLIFIAIAIPAALWRIWRNHPHDDGGPQGSLREWVASNEFRTWQDRVKAKNAAFGMSIFAIIVHFTAR
jgi:hypothetical protein